MEILQLRYFFDSAKTESFAKTAEKYMVPPTSVSASVKRLEIELGCKLFDRSCNRIMLNSNGKRLRESLTLIFDELDKMVESLSAPDADTREIKLLVRGMRKKITDYIIEYKEKHPHITFKTIFDSGESNSDSYDIIIEEKSDTYTDLEKFDLYSTRIRINASASNPLCGRKITLKQLCNQPFISIGEQSNMHKLLIKVCREAGFTPNIAVQCNDLQCYGKWISSGAVIGLGREYGETASNGIVHLDVTDFDERQTICCYYKKQAAYVNVANFLEFLKSKAI
ncbi:MAG: LysR family transcriptional regulator [Clostridia bacterium]|nr:LysR family transcriptional regulator [Clostridia bacterium]